MLILLIFPFGKHYPLMDVFMPFLPSILISIHAFHEERQTELEWHFVISYQLKNCFFSFPRASISLSFSTDWQHGQSLFPILPRNILIIWYCLSVVFLLLWWLLQNDRARFSLYKQEGTIYRKLIKQMSNPYLLFNLQKSKLLVVYL